MRTRVLIAMLAMWAAGCMHYTSYAPVDRSGNQCKNECLAAADEGLLEDCFVRCYDYHGGEFWPSNSCAIRPPESVYKDPPKDPEKVDEFPAPDELRPAEEPPAPPAAPPVAEPPAPAEPAPQPI